MTPPLSAEQLAQHIAAEWGPLEQEERIKMIVVVRNQITAACEEAVRNGPYDYVSIDEAEMKYKEAYEKGASEMRERAAQVVMDSTPNCDEDGDLCARDILEDIRALKLAPEGQEKP